MWGWEGVRMGGLLLRQRVAVSPNTSTSPGLSSRCHTPIHTHPRMHMYTYHGMVWGGSYNLHIIYHMMESLQILALQELCSRKDKQAALMVGFSVLCTPVSDKHQATWINYSSMIVRKYCFHGEGGKMIKVCINHDPSAAPT